MRLNVPKGHVCFRLVPKRHAFDRAPKSQITIDCRFVIFTECLYTRYPHFIVKIAPNWRLQLHAIFTVCLLFLSLKWMPFILAFNHQICGDFIGCAINKCPSFHPAILTNMWMQMQENLSLGTLSKKCPSIRTSSS